MAKIGLKFPVAAMGDYTGVNATTAPTYTGGFVIGNAIAADKEVKFTSNPLYANDTIVEDESSFDSGSLKLGVDDIDEAIQVKLFGHTLQDGAEGHPKTLIKGAADQPPFLGVGYYKTGKKNGIKYFEATWLYKVKFTPPKESAKTSEGKTSWQTPETEGNIYTIPGYKNDAYEEVTRFTTEAEAIAYLKDKAGITTGTGA